MEKAYLEKEKLLESLSSTKKLQMDAMFKRVPFQLPEHRQTKKKTVANMRAAKLVT